MKIDIFALRTLLVPVNVSGALGHWFLVAINFAKRLVLSYNSWSNDDQEKRARMVSSIATMVGSILLTVALLLLESTWLDPGACRTQARTGALEGRNLI